MEQVFNKYINGKIYKITNSNSDKIYIGSTINTLKQRLSSHKTPSSKLTIKSLEIFKIDGDVNIELIEAFPCNCKDELHKRERYHIELNKDIVVNKCIPTRPKKECDKDYRIKNKDLLNAKKKIYYQQNKEHIIEQHKEYLKKKDKDESKQYFRDRYQKNKEERKIYEANRRSTDEYKAKHKEYMKNYYIQHKAELKMYDAEKRSAKKLNIIE